MKLARIHQIAVYARDLDEAISFYQDILGAQYLAKFDPPGLAFFDFSGVRLLLENAGPKATLYFWVEDIDAAFDELSAKGIKFTTEPQLVHRDQAGLFGKPNEEEWMAFFSDPSGNTLAIAARKAGLVSI
jgi:catechol 2,3-dioxygenase-like lactoylglutathione lyase family enzyme